VAGAADHRFIALSNALTSAGAEVVAAPTPYTAFDYLHESAFDAAVLFVDLCDGLQGYARQFGLSLSAEGPTPFDVSGDHVKVRRLTQNLLVNMVGQKRVALVSPAQTPLMRNHRHCFSRFGADATLGSAPKAERPRTLTVDLAPGEALFIPVGWWHHVEALSLTIGMSFTNFVWPNDFSSIYSTEGAL